MIILFGAILFICLIVLAWIDFKTYRLPDRFTLPLIAMGLGQAWVLSDWREALIGAGVGYVVFVSLEIIYRHLRGKDGLGRGDAKLLAAGGAWCGWAGLPFIILIASGTGLLALLLPSFRSRANQGRIPFGPFLAFGIFMVWSAYQFAS